MGKGEIISHAGNGQYQVKLIYDRISINAEISRLTTSISDLESEIAGLPDGDEKDLLILQKTALEKRKEQLENLPEDPTVSAWCGDLTGDLSGNVGTIEIIREKEKGVNIQPGYDGNAAYSSTRDGQLQYTQGEAPATTFYNLAMLPGAQKWKPAYRYGTISNLSGDTCDVTLDSAISSQQDLDVNQSVTLTGVSIDYMNCNGSAFENGDEVLVKFESYDFSQPKVIGFKDNPKSCYWEPWGNTICKNRNWSVELYDPWSETLCPSFPFGDWSLSEDSGNYSVQCSLTIAGDSRSTSLDCVEANNSGEMPNITDTPYLKIKINATTPSNTHYGTYVLLRISANATKSFWFAYARGDFGVSGSNIYVGDNGGAEMVIDLSGYGLSGDVSSLIFIVSAENGDTSTLDCDYFTFTETS